MDRSIVIYKDEKGRVASIGKLIEDRELIFGYNNGRLSLIGNICYGKSRLYSDNRSHIPAHQFNAAHRQAAAIFKRLGSHF